MELTSATAPIDPQKSSKSSSEAGKKINLFAYQLLLKWKREKKKKPGEFPLY